MSKLSVEIPDSVLTDEKRKELTALRGKVRRLENKVRVLERRLSDSADLIKRAKELHSYVRDSFDCYGEDW